VARRVLFALSDSAVLAERVALTIDAEMGELSERDFPDGETYLRIETPVAGCDAVLVAGLRHPNDKLLPLVFLADALHELGATRVGLVAPYLPYMRQDARFHPGEAITSHSFARVVSGAVDWLITIDPHLHRIAALSDVFTIPATAMHSAPAVGAWIARNVKQPFIIGPDEESRQWVETVAAAANAPFTVLAKTRRGDTDVIESIPRLDEHRESTPVLVDDIISTGRTMIEAIRHLREQGAAPSVCVAVHAVFADGAFGALEQAGAARVATTNTIPHPTNEIDIAPIIARGLLDR
jgi:ribose-phosphate pyrophosphokinase